VAQDAVVEQPAQVRQGPAVRIVDQQQDPGVPVGTQVLAGFRRRVGVGAVRRVDHLPTRAQGLGGQQVCQARLSLAALPVQPPHRETRPGVPPRDQLLQLGGAASEVDDLRAGVEHPAGLGPQPRRLQAHPPTVAEQQVHRPAVAEDVDVRADAPVAEAVLDVHDLLDTGRFTGRHLGHSVASGSSPTTTEGAGGGFAGP
jgi:hypothetical protein